MNNRLQQLIYILWIKYVVAVTVNIHNWQKAVIEDMLTFMSKSWSLLGKKKSKEKMLQYKIISLYLLSFIRRWNPQEKTSLFWSLVSISFEFLQDYRFYTSQQLAISLSYFSVERGMVRLKELSSVTRILLFWGQFCAKSLL